MIWGIQFVLVVLLVAGSVSAAPLVRRANASLSSNVSDSVQEIVVVDDGRKGFVLAIFSALVVACIALIALVWKLKSGMRQEQ